MVGWDLSRSSWRLDLLLAVTTEEKGTRREQKKGCVWRQHNQANKLVLIHTVQCMHDYYSKTYMLMHTHAHTYKQTHTHTHTHMSHTHTHTHIHDFRFGIGFTLI